MENRKGIKMKMKHFVMGFHFNKSANNVLLIEKQKPDWQKGHHNGIGGKIDETDVSPLAAMRRECEEETTVTGINWEHVLTFVCPGGTVFVFRAFNMTEDIPFLQAEEEHLAVWPVNALPSKLMNNLKWIIPVCLSTLRFPFIVQQNTLGVE